jgi:hypothetical protein
MFPGSAVITLVVNPQIWELTLHLFKIQYFIEGSVITLDNNNIIEAASKALDDLIP